MRLEFAGVTAATAKTALGSLTLNIEARSFAISGATASGQTLTWTSGLPTWSDGDTVSLSLTAPAPVTVPPAPAALTVEAVENSTTELKVTWSAPSPAVVTAYDVQYRLSGGRDRVWIDGPQDVSGTSATLSGLDADTSYEVRVRASNAKGDGPWSATRSGWTGFVEPKSLTVKFTRHPDHSWRCQARLTWPDRNLKSAGNPLYPPLHSYAVNQRGHPFGGYYPGHDLGGRGWRDIPGSDLKTTSFIVPEPLVPDAEYHFRIMPQTKPGHEEYHFVAAACSAWHVLNRQPSLLELARGVARGAWLGFSYEKILLEDSAPPASAYTVYVAGQRRGVAGVTVEGRTVQLRLEEPVAAGQTVTVDYTPVPGAGQLRSTSGHAVAGFSGRVIENETPPRETAPPAAAALTAHVAESPAAHTGAAFTMRIGFSAALAEGAGKALREHALVVEGGAVKDVGRVDRRRDLWEVRVKPKGYGAVTLRLASAADCASEGAVCTADGRPLSKALDAVVPGPVAFSVADARAKEGVDDTIDFAVTLSRAAAGEVTVRYVTKDDSATAGEDYRRARGKLVFAAGETEKTVSVEVLDDAHDEGEETFTLVLRNASGAVIADGEGVGTIENSDPMPQAWLARFGRTVAGQAMDAVTARLEAGGGGNHVTLGGQQVSLDTPQGRADAAAGADAVARALGADTPGDTWDRDRWMRGEDPEASSRTMTGRELLLGSSFHLSAGGGAADGPAFAAWGRVAQGSFDAEEDGVRLDGAVTTGFLGADVASGRWLAGAAVAVSEGEGTFGLSGDAAAEPAFGEGTVESSLTSVLPYARYAVSERVSVWGLAAWGTGTLTLTAKGAEEEKRYRTDLSMTLGAVGARGALLTPEAADGFALALKGDAFFVRTESDATAGMAAAQGDASRLRLALDGSRAFDMGGGATLTPSLELGVRHDGGDAETGFGADIGGGLAYSGRGLTAALHGRGLLSHEAGGMRERGFSGSLGWDPRPDSERGVSLSLTQTVGASASGGADALLGRETMAGLAANDNGADARRLELKLGYGLSTFGDRFTGTPELGVGLSDTGRDYRLGWRLTSAVPGDPGFEVNLEATRRETANGNEAPEHGVMLRSLIRW